MKVLAHIGDRDLALEVTPRAGGYDIRVGGRERRVEVSGAGPLRALTIDGRVLDTAVWRSAGGGEARRGEETYDVAAAGRLYSVRLVDPLRAAEGSDASTHAGGVTEVRAVMPGRVVAILAAPGAEVPEGAGLLVVEAMKMANEITAPRAGTVRELRVSPGETVEAGAVLAVLE